MVSVRDLLAKVLNCKCSSFESSPERIYQCRNCSTIIPFFKELDEINELPHYEKTSSAENPTALNYVWSPPTDRVFYDRLKIVQYLIHSLPEKRCIGAEISGGAGRWLPHLSLHFEQYIHMDLSRDALKAACVAHRELNNNVWYVQNDLMATHQMVKNVDVAFCLDALMYHGDFVDNTLRSCSKILNSNGVLVLEFGSKYHHILGTYFKLKRKESMRRAFTIREARDILHEHGFDIMKEMYLFKELPFKCTLVLNRLELPDYIINMGTWFYLVVRRNK
jgi:SAM-dependent methyltransferase